MINLPLIVQTTQAVIKMTIIAPIVPIVPIAPIALKGQSKNNQRMENNHNKACLKVFKKKIKKKRKVDNWRSLFPNRCRHNLNKNNDCMEDLSFKHYQTNYIRTANLF